MRKEADECIVAAAACVRNLALQSSNYAPLVSVVQYYFFLLFFLGHCSSQLHEESSVGCQL